MIKHEADSSSHKYRNDRYHIRGNPRAAQHTSDTKTYRTVNARSTTFSVSIDFSDASYSLSKLLMIYYLYEYPPSTTTTSPLK